MVANLVITLGNIPVWAILFERNKLQKEHYTGYDSTFSEKMTIYVFAKPHTNKVLYCLHKIEAHENHIRNHYLTNLMHKCNNFSAHTNIVWLEFCKVIIELQTDANLRYMALKNCNQCVGKCKRDSHCYTYRRSKT